MTPRRLGSRTSIPREVFLSHSDRNRAFAARLAGVLARHGVPVWYSRRSLLGAQQWHDEIGRALRRCDWFIVVLSPHSVRSDWVKRELVFALSHAQYRDRIVPVIHKACDHEALSWTLGGFQMIDFSDDFDAGSRQLLRAWGLGYSPADHVASKGGSAGGRAAPVREGVTKSERKPG
ncbi:MAG: toll/interleukin-1 receptor domain-containing protein [Acidobacteriota bacterium]